MRARADDWQRRLRDVLARYRTGTFATGRCDCGTLWADVVLAVSGVDVLGDLRGRYRTDRGAVRMLRTLGVTSAAELADTRFNRVPVAELHRGDLAMAAPLFGSPLASPCVVDTTHAFAMGRGGLVAIPRAELTHGWAV